MRFVIFTTKSGEVSGPFGKSSRKDEGSFSAGGGVTFGRNKTKNSHIYVHIFNYTYLYIIYIYIYIYLNYNLRVVCLCTIHPLAPHVYALIICNTLYDITMELSPSQTEMQISCRQCKRVVRSRYEVLILMKMVDGHSM